MFSKIEKKFDKENFKIMMNILKNMEAICVPDPVEFLDAGKKSGKFSGIRIVATGKLQKNIYIIIIIREVTLEKLLIGGPEVGRSAGAPSVKISASTMAWSQGT